MHGELCQGLGLPLRYGTTTIDGTFEHDRQEMHACFPVARHVIPVQSGAQHEIFMQKHWHLQFTRAHKPVPVVRMPEALIHHADSLEHGAAEEACLLYTSPSPTRRT